MDDNNSSEGSQIYCFVDVTSTLTLGTSTVQIQDDLLDAMLLAIDRGDIEMEVDAESVKIYARGNTVTVGT